MVAGMGAVVPVMVAAGGSVGSCYSKCDWLADRTMWMIGGRDRWMLRIWASRGGHMDMLVGFMDITRCRLDVRSLGVSVKTGSASVVSTLNPS